MKKQFQLSDRIVQWRDKLKLLEKEELPKALVRIGEAAPAGDWHENAEYEDAERQVELIKTRIDEIKGIIKKLEQEEKRQR